MASSEAHAILERHPHRVPLGGDQIRALANSLMALKSTLTVEKAPTTQVYNNILRLLKAHVTPLPGASGSFAQVQAARLQLLAERLVAEEKEFPKELTAAVSQGLVSGFDPETGLEIPLDQQRAQLANQQVEERNDITREKAMLYELQLDFHKARIHDPSADHAEPTPGPEDYIPWHERKLKIPGDGMETFGFSGLSRDLLLRERSRSLKLRTEASRAELDKALKQHKDGSRVLEPRVAALLESRSRHITLMELQSKMRTNIWNEHQVAERDGRRGSKVRVRTLKQLQREYEKAERSRVRQAEAEERDARRKRQAWTNAMTEHLNKFRSYHRDVVRRGFRAVTKAVLKYHEEVARNASRAEREAERVRIQKLRDDDEEGYLELVRETKNTRLLELLHQTDKYLRELGAVVREERARSGVVEYENSASGNHGKRQDYYEIAHAIKEEVTSQSSLLVGGTLKEYQLQGIQWMVSLYNNRLNGILADEMGLGKTIQTLGLIAHLMERKDNPGPYLVIVPLSTISNWELEFARWAPAIRVVVFKGDAKARRRLYEDVIEKKSFNVCLVTYEYVVRGKTFLKRIEWQHLIIDEGHRIKNHESRLSAVLHNYYRSRNRLLLTGTPLQNSLTELWALLNFLLPNVFKSAESFESWFAAPFAQMGVGNIASTEQQAQLTEEESLLIIRRLHQVLRPFLLRRMKSDVLRMGEQLPEKQEHILLCEMSAWQRQIYVKIVKSERLLFTDRHGKQRYDKLSNPAIQLRKCVNHPYLFFLNHASQIVDSPELWRASGKFDALDSMIIKLLRTDHRILIFNQMTKVVDLQERMLRYRKIPFYRLDGSTSTEDRKKMVNDFNSAGSEVNVFLLTTRAGGLGVNLQTADTVIIFDSDWNPSMDQQAQDRAHRIGQRREVLVLRLLTAKSIEESVLERASFKRGLEKKIIRAGMFDEQSKDSERQAMLRELLRVEGPVSDDDVEDDGLPTEDEVNRILARSEEEFHEFMKVDEERKTEIASRSRLLSESEIPEWASVVPKALREKAKSSGAGHWNSNAIDIVNTHGPKKRRAATENVSYGVDQLSERQYLKIMERSVAGEEISLSEAMKAMSGGRRKKRRKEASTAGMKGREDQEFDKRTSSQVGSEARGDTVEPTVQVSPATDAPVATKSFNADSKSFDDDWTEGGNDGDRDENITPAVIEDMIIEEEEDDDDDDVVIEPEDDDDGGGPDKPDAVAGDGSLEGRAVSNHESETSEEGMEMTHRPKLTSAKGIGYGRGWQHRGKAKRLTPGEDGDTSTKGELQRHKRRKRIGGRLSAQTRSQSDVSEDSRSLGQKTPNVALECRGTTAAEDTDATERTIDEMSARCSKPAKELIDRIPRVRRGNCKKRITGGKGANGFMGHSSPEQGREEDISERNETEEAEDGEIREEGELSDEVGEDKAQVVLTQGRGSRRVEKTIDVGRRAMSRFGGGKRGAEDSNRSIARARGGDVDQLGVGDDTGEIGSMVRERSSAQQRGGIRGRRIGDRNVEMGGVVRGSRELRQFGRMPMAQMGRASGAVGVGVESEEGEEQEEEEEDEAKEESEEVEQGELEVGSGEDTEEEGEIVED